MIRLAVVAYPSLEEADQQWIESIRAHHDRQASRIGVHFTLVFPTDLSPAAVVAETAAVVGMAGPIPFAVRRAEAVRDPEGDGGHVFLIPDEGSKEITALHDCLYEGVLQSQRREEIPYVPHMTVAANSDWQECEALAQELNAARRTVRGTVWRVDLVGVGTARVQTARSFKLGGSNATW